MIHEILGKTNDKRILVRLDLNHPFDDVLADLEDRLLLTTALEEMQH